MGKKTNVKNNKKSPYEIQNQKKPRRWDHIFGILTLSTVVLFGFMIYNDFKGNNTDTQVGNTKNNISDNNISVKDNYSTTENDVLSIKDGSVICVDAGHGGSDKGTISGSNVESSICLLIAQALQRELENMGAKVVMTRTSDTSMSQEQRVQIGNDSDADIFISLHLNSSTNETANGAEAWIHSSKPSNSLKLSKTILAEIATKTGIHNRDVKYGTLADSQENYYINSHSKSESVMLELGFITNNSDMAVINSKMDSVAKAIASGIEKYFNGGN